MKLADDLNIELETTNADDSVAFRLNGNNVCDLTKGDDVVLPERSP